MEKKSGGKNDNFRIEIIFFKQQNISLRDKGNNRNSCNFSKLKYLKQQQLNVHTIDFVFFIFYYIIKCNKAYLNDKDFETS